MTDFFLNREQSRDVDVRAIRDYGMSSLVLMENAGRACVDRLVLLGIDCPVVICCGKGNNGGDGLVMARHLEARGKAVKVLLFAEPETLSDDAAANFETLRRAKTPIRILNQDFTLARLDEQLAAADWIVDALLGTGAKGNPRSPHDEVIRRMNEQDTRKLAIDLPSGLDCDTGEQGDPTFRADHTFSLVTLKRYTRFPSTAEVVGDVHVLDIGLPKQLLDEVREASLASTD